MKKAASITSEVFNKFFKERVMEIVDADEVNGKGDLFMFYKAVTTPYSASFLMGVQLPLKVRV